MLAGIQEPTGGDGSATAAVAVVVGPGGSVEPALPMLDGSGGIDGTPADVLVTITD